MNILEPLSISELSGKQFFIKHYQRGYRWTKHQVEQLLDDIDSFTVEKLKHDNNRNTFYCLQPVVVKSLDEDTKKKRKLEGEWYEVIDGQQRLTTIYLILQYMNEFWLGRQKKELFNIDYETREGCVQFLKKIKVNEDLETVNVDKSNIDFYHISVAYQTIRDWENNYMKNHSNQRFDSAAFQSKFLTNSKVIWYEVKEEKSEELFERLNLGKIPLTVAELTKALFLSENSFHELTGEERKVKHFEIAYLWDEIEHKLNEPDLKFWSFITNKNRFHYDTKIELLLDIVSDKDDGEKDPFYTFLYFYKENNLAKSWTEIEELYQTLIDWSNEKELYHKIGYLIARKLINSKDTRVSLKELIRHYKSNTKKVFNDILLKYINASISENISELEYPKDNNTIYNILLLFNVETHRTAASIDDFYPFKLHKNNFWSLEHIHARNSDGLDKNKQDQWIKWLNLHLPVLSDLRTHEDFKKKTNEFDFLISEINQSNNDKLSWQKFIDIFDKVNDLLTSCVDKEKIDSDAISNMALLTDSGNSALNCSAFEVKRRFIITMDKEGKYIPICTKRVFHKTYHISESNSQTFYWSIDDRKAYLAEIRKTLADYLNINSITEEENDDQ